MFWNLTLICSWALRAFSNNNRARKTNCHEHHSRLARHKSKKHVRPLKRASVQLSSFRIQPRSHVLHPGGNKYNRHHKENVSFQLVVFQFLCFKNRKCECIGMVFTFLVFLKCVLFSHLSSCIALLLPLIVYLLFLISHLMLSFSLSLFPFPSLSFPLFPFLSWATLMGCSTRSIM